MRTFALGALAGVATMAGLVAVASCSGGGRSAASPPGITGVGQGAAGATPAAASPSTASASATAAAGATVGAAAGGGPEPANGAEPSTVRYVHPSGWRIDSPAPMKATADGGAAYWGPSDFLRVTPVPGPSDPVAVAAAEVARPTGPGYALVKGPHPVTANGKPATEVEYREAGMRNPVTGKATVLRAVRLYAARPGGGVFRVEYGSTATVSTWDPQGASDVVTTFNPGP